jgi:hypothetical protein
MAVVRYSRRRRARPETQRAQHDSGILFRNGRLYSGVYYTYSRSSTWDFRLIYCQNRQEVKLGRDA